jgi:hypothetical protein
MTQFDETDDATPIAPVPVQVIGYASEGTINVATGGTRALLGILGGFHFLIGVPVVLVDARGRTRQLFRRIVPILRN